MVVISMILLAIFICIILSMLLFLFIALISAAIGGATASVLVKDKTIKNAFALVSAILFLIAVMCITPFAVAFNGMTPSVSTIISTIDLICIEVLGAIGIKFSCEINNNTGKKVFIAVFCILMLVTIPLRILLHWE